MSRTITALGLVLCLVLASNRRTHLDDAAPLLGDDFIWAAEAGDHATTRPAVTFDGIEDALKMVPHGVLPSKPEEWTVAKVDAANIALAAHVQGRLLRLHMSVVAITRNIGVDEATRTQSQDGYDVKLKELTAPIYDTDLHAAFSSADTLDVARLKVGDELTVEGNVLTMRFEERVQNQFPTLVLQLNKSHIVKNAAK
jgi:hypothetical protein